MRSSAWVVGLLLVSMLAGLSSVTSVSPVQIVTSYAYTSVPISTIIWSSTTQLNLLSGNDTDPAHSLHYTCEYVFEDFTASAGTISGTVTSDNLIDVFLVTQAVGEEWIKTGTCDGPSYDQYLTARTSTTNYSFTANLPSSGTYELLILNQSSENTAHIDFTVNSAGTVTYTTTSYSMSQQTFLFTESTSISLQEQTQTSSSSGQTPGFVSSLLMFGVIAVIVIALVAVILIRRGKTRKEGSPTRVYEPETTAAQDQPKVSMFCRKCGAKIPRDSTFCKECGEKIAKV